MSKLRQRKLSNYSIGGMTRQVIASAKHACENELLHVILDSYCEMSLKEGNQLRRSNITPIDLSESLCDWPKLFDHTYWASTQNRQGLGQQLLARELIKEYYNVLVSSMIDNNEIFDNTQLKKWIEEGVARIVPRVAWAIFKPRLWKGSRVV